MMSSDAYVVICSTFMWGSKDHSKEKVEEAFVRLLQVVNVGNADEKKIAELEEENKAKTKAFAEAINDRTKSVNTLEAKVAELEKAARWVCAEEAMEVTDTGRLSEALDALNKASGDSIKFEFGFTEPAEALADALRERE